MVYSVGLTGTVASGKSTVARIFADLGIEVISSDGLARALTRSGEPAFLEIIRHFGNDLKMPNGELDRRRLRNIILKNESERLWLENLLHPLIRQGIQEKMRQAKGPFCIIEIPLLYRRQDFPWLNSILAVTTSDELAIKRLMQRDHCSRADAEALLSLQKNRLDNDNLADNILVNTGSLPALENKTLQLYQHYLWKSLNSS